MIQKIDFFNICNTIVEENITSLSSSISEIKNDLNSATKSSAGDKHEVGRAMMHIELEKQSKHLSELNKSHQTLHLISLEVNIKHNQIKLGSLVLLSNGQLYYISLSLGKLNTKDKEFYAISPITPLACLLLNQKVNDVINFRGQKLTIKELY